MWSHGRRVLPLLANSSLHPLPQRLPTLLRGGLAVLTRVRSPVVPPAGTTGPFTSTGKKSRLRLSSSGGGLFDGRPKTQTWVWGAFVFPLAGKSGRIALPSLPRRFLAGNMRRTQGQCPSGCANPKACTNPHGAADSLDCKRSSRVSCTIYAGYGALGGRHQTCQLLPGLFQDEIGHRFHKLSTVCGSGVVGEVDGDPAIPGAPCRPAPWTQSG
jgi:hypothetical protein